jgi:hypothetical protein
MFERKTARKLSKCDRIGITATGLGLEQDPRTEYCTTGTHLLLLPAVQNVLNRLNLVSQAPPRRAKCPAEITMPEGGRSERLKAGSRPPQSMGITGPFLAGAAVSPPGPQRIIAQMLRACGIQTDRSKHYVVHALQLYCNTKFSTSTRRNLLWQMDS